MQDHSTSTKVQHSSIPVEGLQSALGLLVQMLRTQMLTSMGLTL